MYTIERYETGEHAGKVRQMIFHCDHEGCGVALTDIEIADGGGLAKMDWECIGGKHFCPGHRMTPLPGVQAITEERRRQIEIEGWTPSHDDAYRNGELARAAACYAIGSCPTGLWPWHEKWWKPGDRRRDLEKAGALIAAEIDRIDRTQGGTNG
jgi:hypothetical protein